MSRSSKKSEAISLGELKVPNMGESVSQAVVGRLLVDSGENVKAGQEVIELETDKLNQNLSAPLDGVMQWQVEPGETVLVGHVLALIEPRPSDVQESLAQEEKKTLKKQKSQEPTPSVHSLDEVQVASSMQQLPGIASITGTRLLLSDASDSNIRISREQTLRESSFPKKTGHSFVSEPAQPAQAVSTNASSVYKETRSRLPQMRKTIAQRLLKVQHESAMLTTFNEIDMSAVMQLREKFGEKFLQKHGVKLGFMSFFVKAAVSALKKEPALNARIESDEWVQRLDYHLGVAVSTEKGLVVPVLRDCDQLSLADIENQLSQVASKAREGKILLEDLQGGSFTITNGGVFGSLLSTPILNPPQSGILGMHKIQKRPIVNERDEIVARPMMYIALTYDHRVVDGRQAVGFLVAIKEAIEQPEKLWLDI